MSDGQWIKCSERMPDHHIRVLVIARYEDTPLIGVYISAGKLWREDSSTIEADSGPWGNGAVLIHPRIDVTHWQPLPAPPKPEEAAQ